MPNLHNLFLEQKPPGYLAALNRHLSADGVTVPICGAHVPQPSNSLPRAEVPSPTSPTRPSVSFREFDSATHQGLRPTSHQVQYRDESTSKCNGRVA